MNPSPSEVDASWTNMVRPLLVEIAAVAFGGAIGALMRHMVTRVASAVPGGSAVYGTLFVNLVGCFAIGLLAGFLLSVKTVSPTAQLAIRTGFLGSLTTFSTFALESHTLISGQRSTLGWIYVASSVFLGLAAVGAGVAFSKSWWQAT